MIYALGHAKNTIVGNSIFKISEHDKIYEFLSDFGSKL